MRHFLRLLVTRRWGWTLIAALVILGGILWGVSSPLIPYETSASSGIDNGKISYYVGAAENGDIYIWTTDKTNPTFYVARHQDFNPSIDRTQLHLEAYVYFTYRSDTISEDEHLDANTHVTQAHIIEQLIIYDMNRHVTGTYTTSDYNANQDGYYDNRWWPGGIATIAIGLLIAFLALFAGRKKRGSKAPDQSDPNWPYVGITPYPTLDQNSKQ